MRGIALPNQRMSEKELKPHVKRSVKSDFVQGRTVNTEYYWQDLKQFHFSLFVGEVSECSDHTLHHDKQRCGNFLFLRCNAMWTWKILH